MTPRPSLFADVGVKLLALVLAWGVWYVVREDLDEPRNASLAVQVEIAPGASLQASIVGPSRVDVKIRGSRRDVDFLAGGTRPLLAVVRDGDLAVDQRNGRRDFRAEDLTLPEPLRPGAVRILEMQPESLVVRIFRVAQKSVTLATPEFPGKEELNVQVERMRWPQSAVVRATEDVLRTHPSLKTTVERAQFRRMVEAMGDAARTTVALPLTLLEPPPEDVTLIHPRELEVTCDLVRSTESTVKVPLTVLREADAVSRGVRPVGDESTPWLEFDPENAPSIVLPLRGNPRALATVTAQSIRAFVLESELPAGASEGRLRIHTSDLPTGVVVAREDLSIAVRTTQ